MLVQGKLLYPKDDLTLVYQIRRKVFIDELNNLESNVFDDYDSDAIHALIYGSTDQMKAVATGRIFFEKDRCYLSQIAVLKEYRGSGYGDLVVRMLLNKAFNSHISTIYIKNISVDLLPFFERVGFQVDNDEINNTNDIQLKINMNMFRKGCSK